MFARGDYQAALAEFLNLERRLAQDTSSLTEAELTYNIAVCYYKLQQWQAANERFRQAHRQQADNPLVKYNLAVTEKKLGRNEQAHELFFELALEAEDKDLAALALQQYQLIDADSTRSKTTNKARLIANAAVSFGTDDNVIDPADLSGSGADDTFVDTAVALRWLSDTKQDNAWVVDGIGYLSRYSDVSEYDIDTINLGLRKNFRNAFGRWYLGSGVDRTWLGGDGFLNGLAAKAGTQIRLSEHAYWDLDYRFQYYSELSDEFEALSGHQHRIDLGYSRRHADNTQTKLRYRFELDDRDDADFGDAFTSYSAQRHTLSAGVSHRLDQWQLGLNASYRRSRHLDEHLFVDESRIRREDERLRLEASALWQFSPNWGLNIKWSLTDNQSNIETYDYDQRLISIGVDWLWD